LASSGEARITKIVRIESYVVGNPWKNWLFTKVVTDEGCPAWARTEDRTA
jgi:hypothetical protein